MHGYLIKMVKLKVSIDQNNKAIFRAIIYFEEGEKDYGLCLWCYRGADWKCICTELLWNLSKSISRSDKLLIYSWLALELRNLVQNFQTKNIRIYLIEIWTIEKKGTFLWGCWWWLSYAPPPPPSLILYDKCYWTYKTLLLVLMLLTLM